MVEKLGTVLHATRNGYIVVVPEDPKKLPRLGLPVYDKDLRIKYGSILDVIGPVEKPLIVVKPASKEVLESIKPGEELYYVPPRPKRKKPRRPRGGGKPRKRGGRRGG